MGGEGLNIKAHCTMKYFGIIRKRVLEAYLMELEIACNKMLSRKKHDINVSWMGFWKRKGTSIIGPAGGSRLSD